MTIEVTTYREDGQWVAAVEWKDEDGGSDGQEAVGGTRIAALKALVVELAGDNAEYLRAIAGLTGFE